MEFKGYHLGFRGVTFKRNVLLRVEYRTSLLWSSRASALNQPWSLGVNRAPHQESRIRTWSYLFGLHGPTSYAKRAFKNGI